MIVICENEKCKKEFDKPTWQVKKSNHNFCCRKCSNIMSNTNRWKDHISLQNRYKCEKCGKKRGWRSKNKLCENCYNTQQREKNKLITIGELKRKHNSRTNGRWYSAEIRNYARMWNPELVNKPCQKCGYSHHTELCHITAIKDFDDNIILGEVNDPKNLVVLCPNHHWEFDNKTGGSTGI